MGEAPALLPLILVVDDDDRIRELLQRYLAGQGYYVVVAATTAEAEEILGGLRPEAVILDVMMPGEDGFAFLRRTGVSRQLPVLMLSALGEAEDRIRGLELGVHDYLPKPFEPRELLLRLGVLLQRRREAQTAQAWLVFGPFRLHRSSGRLLKGEEPVYLTASEQAFLQRLAAVPGQPIDREELAELLPPGSQERSVDVQVNRLRRKIEQDPKKPEYILTQRGSGYVLRV